MLDPEHGFRVVDVHAHLAPDEAAAAARGRAVEPERLERELRSAGVVRAVVSPPPAPTGSGTDGYLRANNAVARRCVDRPFLTFARLAGPLDARDRPAARLRNLTASRGPEDTGPDDVEQYAYDDRFHGFALDPVADGVPDDDTLAALADVDLPVLLSAGTRFTPRTAVATVASYGFPVVLGSFGGYPLDRGLMHEAVDLLDEHDRLYVDTAAVRYRDVLERGLLEHPDRVLFGSGAPDVHPEVAVTELLTLDVSADALRRAFDRNAARVVPALDRGAD